MGLLTNFEPRAILILAAWIAHLVVGTVFYTYRDHLGLAKGFYMAVNVGYSIGWGFPIDPDDGSKAFSIMYLLVGASFVVASLGFFTRSAMERQKKWYVVAALQQEGTLAAATLNLGGSERTGTLADASTPQAAAAMAHGWVDKMRAVLNWLHAWLYLGSTTIKAMLVFFVWILWGTFWSCNSIGWSIITGIYYCVSYMSTGGLWAIPQESSDWQYGLTGIYTAIGVPIMAFAMGQLTHLLFSPESMNDKQTLHSKITTEELDMMQKLRLDNKDGTVDLKEFITLSLLRLDAVSLELLNAILQRFDELDKSGDGVLSYCELLETPEDEVENIEAIPRLDLDLDVTPERPKHGLGHQMGAAGDDGAPVGMEGKLSDVAAATAEQSEAGAGADGLGLSGPDRVHPRKYGRGKVVPMLDDATVTTVQEIVPAVRLHGTASPAHLEYT